MLSVKPGKDIMKLSNKNFTVLHGTGKNKAILTEAEDFDQLASALSVYRKLSYSNITVYHPKEKGIRINNQPDNNGKQTGYFQFDFYGCWYEVQPDNGSDNYLMIGEYPYQY